MYYWNENNYVLKAGTRLFQLCHPSLTPMKFTKVSENELNITTRGQNGFGSTGADMNIVNY